MKTFISSFAIWGLTCVICANASKAVETTTNPPGPAIEHELPEPVVRFVTKAGDVTNTTATNTSSAGLAPFPVPPYSSATYGKMVVESAVGTVTATYSPGAAPDAFFTDWEVTYTGVYNPGHFLSWYVTTGFGPNMTLFLADATNKSPTSVTKPAAPPEKFITWTLSGLAPVNGTSTNTTTTRGSSDFEEMEPLASFDGSRRQNCEYKAVAASALAGTKAVWFEIFTPDDGSAKPEYNLRTWEIAGKESQVYTLSCPRRGTSKVALLDDLASIAVDANRDGVIKLASEDASDATSADKPFRFWINDDDDTEGTKMMDGSSGPPFDEADKVPATVADYTRHKINSKRNLEDFARLWIDMTGLQSMVTTSAGIQVGLKWNNVTDTPAVNLYVSADATGSDNYLKIDQAAFNQTNYVAYNNAITFANSQQTVNTSGTFVFPLALLQTELQRGPVLHLLFEGAGIGTGQLTIVLLDKDGNQIGEGPGVRFDLMSIKSMYQRAKATADGTTAANGIDCTIPFPSDYTGPDNNNIPHPNMGWTSNDLSYAFRPDPNEDLEHKTYIVFVHGWNQSPDRATMFAETMFKRLWHQGYKGRFATFRWPTLYSDTGIDILDAVRAHYNDSEYRAWKSGDSLRQYVTQLPTGYARNVVAHSMGNIVVGSALQHGMSASNYALLNAAVPAMCYDQSATLRQASWHYTTPNDDPDPGTRALAYVGQLQTLNTNSVSFFLPQDSSTVVPWELNNSTIKPQRYKLFLYPLTTGYGYERSAAVGQRLFITFELSLGRYLIDPHESMPYATQSLTKAVGADGRTAGSINSSVSLDTWNFGTQHSAEWERGIQETAPFFARLLIELQVSP